MRNCEKFRKRVNEQRPKEIDTRPVRQCSFELGGASYSARSSASSWDPISSETGRNVLWDMALIGSLVGYFGCSIWECVRRVTKFVAVLSQRGQPRRRERCEVAACSRSRWRSLAIVVALAISPFVERIFSIPPGSEQTARVATVIMAATLRLHWFTGVYGGYSDGAAPLRPVQRGPMSSRNRQGAAIVIALETARQWRRTRTKDNYPAVIQLFTPYQLSGPDTEPISLPRSPNQHSLARSPPKISRGFFSFGLMLRDCTSWVLRPTTPA